MNTIVKNILHCGKKHTHYDLIADDAGTIWSQLVTASDNQMIRFIFTFMMKGFSPCSNPTCWIEGRGLISVPDRVQPRGSDTENTGQGSKHFPKWVNIWQPKSNKSGDMSILGHIFRAFVKCFKMKQEVGKFMPLAPTLLPPVSQKGREDGD